MDPCFSSAISLNNVGVDSLEQGDFDGALACFSQAMATSNAYLAMAYEDGSESEDMISLDLENVSLQVAASSPSSNHDLDDDTATYATSKGIKVAASTIVADNKHEAMTIMYCTSATVLYNIARALHAKGVATKTQDSADNSSRLLGKAQSFYLRAWSILRDAGVSLVSSTGNALIDILTMSIFNCLALSSLQLCRCEDCRSYVSSLVGFAVTVRPDHHQYHHHHRADEDNGEEICAILERHKVFFLTNALTMSPPTTAAAA